MICLYCICHICQTSVCCVKLSWQPYTVSFFKIFQIQSFWMVLCGQNNLVHYPRNFTGWLFCLALPWILLQQMYVYIHDLYLERWSRRVAVCKLTWSLLVHKAVSEVRAVATVSIWFSECLIGHYFNFHIIWHWVYYFFIAAILWSITSLTDGWIIINCYYFIVMSSDTADWTVVSCCHFMVSSINLALVLAFRLINLKTFSHFNPYH